jgi:hypothetical protein
MPEMIPTEVIKNGKPVFKQVFNQKNYTKEEVKEILQKEADKFKREGKNMRMMLTVHHENGRYYSAKSFNCRNNVIISDNKLDSEDWEETDAFIIYLWQDNMPANAVGEDENNDCLFEAIKTALRYYRLPIDLKTGEQFKSFLGLNRTDKVPLTIPIIQKLENKLKVNINVLDFYTSSNKSNFYINLEVKDEHISLIKNNNKPASLLSKIPMKKKQLVLFQDHEDHVELYDGEYKRVSHEEFRKLSNFSFSGEYSYIDTVYRKDENKMTLKEKYDYYLDECEKLTNISTILDLSTCDYKPKNLALRLLHYNLLCFEEPEPMDSIEQQWIFKSFKGGLIFSQPCALENGYEYDINSAYPYMLCDSHFSFPIKKGEFKKLDGLNDKFVSYGIYRAIIERDADYNKNKLFRFNNENYYNHLDIETARRLGLKISLIQDGQANALLYSKGRATGSQYFISTIHYLFQYKKTSPLIKMVVNSIWGALSQREKIEKTTFDKKINLNDEEIIAITPFGNYEKVKYLKSGKYFRYNYGRIGCFLTSAVRKYMALQMIPYKEHIFKCHTDSILSDIELPLNISDKIGEWKISNQGKVNIKNCRVAEWI